MRESCFPLHMTTAGVLAIAVAAALSPDEPAATQRETVLVFDCTAAFERALESALVPWQLSVVCENDLAGDAAVFLPRMRELAAGKRARAAVWLTGDLDETTLWIYDASTERVVSRSASHPLDATRAASMALSVKSVLRESGLLVELPEPPATKLRRQAGLRLDAQMGVRALGSPVAEPMTSLGIAVWPHPRFGIAVAVHLGSGVPIEGHGGSLVLSRTDAEMTARSTASVGKVRFEPFLGVGFERMTVDGNARMPDVPSSSQALRPRIVAGLAADASLGRPRVGFQLTAAALPISHEFLVAGEPAIALPGFELSASIRIVWPIY